MRTRLTAGVLAVACSAAIVASALPATAASQRNVPKGFHSSASVPWSQVGRGWVLAQWDPHDNQRIVSGSYLVLVAPDRARYLLWRVGSQNDVLTAWSGDGQRALFVTQGATTRFTVIDVRTGATLDAFVLPTSDNVFYERATFTRPDGLALLVSTQTDDHQLLQRYSLSGALEQTYPDSYPGVGAYGGGALPSPDGLSLVLSMTRGLAVVDDDGALQRGLRFSEGCGPQRWWSSTTILASCASRLYVFSVDGGAPTAITRRNVPPDDGDLSGWRLGSSVYVQVASACGYEYLAKLQGTDPVRVHVPGVPVGNTVTVVGVTRASLALDATIACQGGPSLLFYDPSTDRAPQVIGQPATSGSVDTALIFPPPLG